MIHDKENNLLEALLDLNTAFMLEMFVGDFSITLSSNDFDRFVTIFEAKYKHLVSYPQLYEQLTKLNHIKIAGPGSYFNIFRGKE